MSGPSPWALRSVASVTVRPAGTVDVLALCGRTMASAQDGRGVRGARVEARNALVRLGHAPDDAQRMAEAMQAVAATIRAAVARAGGQS